MREQHTRIGGFLLWLNDEPQHQLAFQVGARGEKTVAGSIERCIAEGASVALYNRRMPGGRGDIDHLVVAPSGVYVIDTKAVTGKVRVEGPTFAQPKLLVDGRDRTSYLDGLDRQVSVVGDVLAEMAPPDHPIRGVLCFTKADLPFLRTQELRGYRLMYQRRLRNQHSNPVRSQRQNSAS